MDAVSHKETATQRKLFKGGKQNAALGSSVAAPRPAPARNPLFGEVRRQAMDAIKNVETVAQVGAIKLTGGIALYAAHIRQMDREARQRTAQRNARTPQRVERLGRD